MLILFSEFDPACWDECIADCGLMTARLIRTFACSLMLAVLGVLLSSVSGYAQRYDIAFDDVDFPSVLPLPTDSDDSSAESETGPALEAPEPADPVEEGASLPDLTADETAPDGEPKIPEYAKALMPLSSDRGDITFSPGLRIQPRYSYDGNSNNNDFHIRRFRLKAGGKAYDLAKYYLELKIDGTGQFEASPSAQVENAWLDFPLAKDEVYLRAGLYDIPFSRDALTSDSKLLFMDRSLIKDAITGIGDADNTVGLMLHGRPYCGRYEYAIGVFDNLFFEKVGPLGTRDSNELQPAGRFAVCLLDPATALDGYGDYWASYIGQGNRLDVGVNAGHLGRSFDGLVELDHQSAWGVDLFYNSGPYVFQTEFDWFVEDLVGVPDIDGNGWYAQGGYLLSYECPVELAARYQVLDSDLLADTLRWTSLGINYYIRDHNLKIQTDYTFRDGGIFDHDLYQIQIQLDF
jgi:hypothetical protein